MEFEELKKDENGNSRDSYRKLGYYYGYCAPFPKGWNRLLLMINIAGLILAISEKVFVEVLLGEIFVYISLVWIYHGFIKDGKKNK